MMIKHVTLAALAAALSFAISAKTAEAQQWITTADGCTYSRTKAPGYPVQWILVRNPTHINKPYGGEHCKNML